MPVGRPSRRAAPWLRCPLSSGRPWASQMSARPGPWWRELRGTPAGSTKRSRQSLPQVSAAVPAEPAASCNHIGGVQLSFYTE